MRRLFLYVLLIWFACASSVVICVIWGRLQPPPEVFKALHIDDCNGVTCVQGIIPGVTSWAEVKSRYKSRFAELYSSKPGTYLIDIQLNAHIDAIFGGNENPERVNSIQVYNDDPTSSPTVGMLFVKYRAPCKIQVFDTGGFIFVYPLLTANVDVPKYIPREITTLNSELIVSAITLSSMANSCSLDVTLDMDLDHYDAKWLGLATLAKYYYPR